MGVYLLRESAKVTKEIKERKKFKLAKRMHGEVERDDVPMGGAAASERRRRDENGRGIPVNNP